MEFFMAFLPKIREKDTNKQKIFLINEENNKLALMTNILTLKKDD